MNFKYNILDIDVWRRNMKRHTVILGAGATIAAIPNGDKNGRKSSVMNGLIEKLNLHEVLKGIELKTQSAAQLANGAFCTIALQRLSVICFVMPILREYLFRTSFKTRM